MNAIRMPALALLATLCGCVAAANVPPPAPPPGGVARSVEQNGRFIALVGERRQHAAPFLGVPGTNFYLLRSWLDTRSGERVTQLYVEDSYIGAERDWQAARDAQGRPLKFVPISKNEIGCEPACSYAEEFAAELPEPLLRASPAGLTVAFTAKSGAAETIRVPGDLVQKQLAAIDTVAAPRPAAAAVPPPPR